MRNIFLLGLIVLSGCTTTPYRTGSIVVNKFTTASMENRNPIDIRPDVLQIVQDSVQRDIVKFLQEKGRMKIAQSCKDADYELVGSFTEMDMKIDSHFRLVTVTVSREFTADIEGRLIDCKTGKTIKEFSVDENDENVANATECLAESVISKIEK